MDQLTWSDIDLCLNGDNINTVKELETKLERKTQTYLQLKQRIIATNSVLQINKQYKAILEEHEKQQVNIKRSNGELTKKYQELLQKNYRLEMQCENYKEEIMKLTNLHSNCKNETDALSQHAKQLQVFIRELEVKLEAKELEVNLITSEKKSKEIAKQEDDKHKKKIKSLQKERWRLLNQVVSFGEKLQGKHERAIVNKYRRLLEQKNYSTESLFSDNEEKLKIECGSTSSVDTGRGSSLLFSEDNTPICSPPCDVTLKIVPENPRNCDVSTSPIKFLPQEKNYLSDDSANVSNRLNYDLSTIFKEMSMDFPMLKPITSKFVRRRPLKSSVYCREIVNIKKQLGKRRIENVKLMKIIKNIKKKINKSENKIEKVNTKYSEIKKAINNYESDNITPSKTPSAKLLQATPSSPEGRVSFNECDKSIVSNLSNPSPKKGLNCNTEKVVMKRKLSYSKTNDTKITENKILRINDIFGSDDELDTQRQNLEKINVKVIANSQIVKAVEHSESENVSPRRSMRNRKLVNKDLEKTKETLASKKIKQNVFAKYEFNSSSEVENMHLSKVQDISENSDDLNMFILDLENNNEDIPNDNNDVVAIENQIFMEDLESVNTIKAKSKLSKLKLLRKKLNRTQSKIPNNPPTLGMRSRRKKLNPKINPTPQNLEKQNQEDAFKKAIEIMKSLKEKGECSTNNKTTEINQPKRSLRLRKRVAQNGQCEPRSNAESVQLENSINKISENIDNGKKNKQSHMDDVDNVQTTHKESAQVQKVTENKNLVNYAELDLFESSPQSSAKEKPIEGNIDKNSSQDDMAGQSLFQKMFMQYAILKPKNNPIIDEWQTESIVSLIDTHVSTVLENNDNTTKIHLMNNAILDISKICPKTVIRGLVVYLMHPNREKDIMCMKNTPPAPPMSKNEQVVMFILRGLEEKWPTFNLIPKLWSYIEFVLFRLNNTPELVQVENLSRFYAVLCRYKKALSRLRLFIFNALYCLSYKALPLAKQCLLTWRNALPAEKYAKANDFIVFAMVYLLYFYKSDSLGRGEDHSLLMRQFISKKFKYQASEWTEKLLLSKIKEFILTADKHTEMEKKLFTMAVMCIAKRGGVQWTQSNLITKVIMPTLKIEEGIDISAQLLGVLLKPYPDFMRLHCLIVFSKLQQLYRETDNPVTRDKLFRSLIMLRKHNRREAINLFISTEITSPSVDTERILKSFIREKPIKSWETSFK